MTVKVIGSKENERFVFITLRAVMFFFLFFFLMSERDDVCWLQHASIETNISVRMSLALVLFYWLPQGTVE